MTTRQPLLNPTELQARLKRPGASAPPVLPSSWTATVLLSPYGDANPPLANYSQHVIAEVAYDSALHGMLFDLYLTQDLVHFRWLFLAGGWYWMGTSDVAAYYGPFATPLVTPAANFLSPAVFGGNWPIMGFGCDNWVLPTPNGSQAPDHGSWYSFREDTAGLYRIFTFDSSNPQLIPILGSYYLANFNSFTPAGDTSALASLVKTVKSGTAKAAPGFANPLVTQEDIQSAMANPLASDPCTLADLQSLIAGFVPAPSNVPIPQWTNQTFIEAVTLGMDLIPYPTYVVYWYSYGQQQSIFIGLGLENGQGNFDLRQDCCLFTTYTDVPQYVWGANGWTPSCCDGKIPGVGLPVPNWVSADGGVVTSQITGNPNFGLAAGETLNLCQCSLDRGGGSLAIFWVWFTGDQAGVLFTEANFVDPTSHNLQLIDYIKFEQNASWISASDFSDPCPQLQACPSSPAKAAVKASAPANRIGGPRRIVGK